MKKKLIGVAAAAVLLMLAVLLLMVLREPEDQIAPTVGATHGDTLGTEEQTQLTPVDTSAPVTEATTETVLPETESTTEPETVRQETEEETQPPATETTEPPKTTQPPKVLEFPYSVPGSSLVILKIDRYDGIFLEDGSDSEVTGISAMVLVNLGSTDVEYAEITLQQGERSLRFKVTTLPAGASIVVQEASAAGYLPDSYNSCVADVAEVDAFEMSEGIVKVVDNQNGTLTVTNLTDTTIPCVRVFYKFSMIKGSVYVGGITYTSKIENLAPGASQTLIPSHYDSEASEVVMVRTYAES